MFMDRILEFKRKEVTKLAETASSRLERVRRARRPRDFRAAIRQEMMSIIAEIKPKSPSRGNFSRASDPVALAFQYQNNGASALSVLADSKFFGGGPALVERIANEPRITIPVLYKDFVVDPQQIYEARACGADAVLLITRAITRQQISDFVSLAANLGLAALVETFDEDDIAGALKAGADIVGVNNRDLRTFEVDLGRSARLSSLIPSDVAKISESGILSRADVMYVEQSGFDAILVGETLLTAPDPGAKLADLLSQTVSVREQPTVTKR